MKRKLFRNIFVLSAVLFLLTISIAEWYVTGAVRKSSIDTLAANLVTQAGLIARDLSLPPADSLDPLCRELKKTTGARVTIIAMDGTVLGDSDARSAAMDNHRSRPEVQAAVLNGTGVKIRRSDTVAIDLLYVARVVRTRGPEQGIVRLSVPLTAVVSAVSELRVKLSIVIAVILLVAGLFLIRQLDRVRRLTDRLREFSIALSRGEYGHRLFLPHAGEFEEIAGHMNDMAISLQSKLKALQDEKAKLESALLGISDGVILLSTTGRVVIANRAFRELFAIREEIEGRPYFEVIRNHQLIELVRNAHERRRAFSGEAEIAHPRQIFVMATALPIIQESMREDRYRGTVVALHDITRLKLLEQVRKDFVANVSHELRTPIAAIRGFSETLLDGALDAREDAERFVGIILNHSARLQRLVDDLLTLSRIELGEMQFAMQSSNAGQLVANTAALIQGKASEKKIGIVQQIDAGLPAIAVDPDRITQVLVNLLDNAVKFSPENGTVRIIVRSRTCSPSGEGTAIEDQREGIEIIIEDSGPGIPPASLPRIGERFYRVDPARSRELGGTGLGLAIVKHILQAHGSSLRVENSPRKGAIVSFCLPAVTEKKTTG